MIRAFIAIDLPDEVRAAVAAAQRQLRQVPVGVKVSWSNIANLHLTLQFLGDVAAAQVPAISAGLEQAVGGEVPFDIAVTGAGGFPDPRRPRVVWVGCRDEAGRLWQLAEIIRGALQPLGFAPEHRDFTAHLTIARIKFPRPDAALTRAVDSLTTQAFGTMRVAVVHLFQSQLHPTGSVYTKISSHTLKGENHHGRQS